MNTYVLKRRLRETSRELYWSENDRDEAECIVCGRDEPLEVHHRDGNTLNLHMVNLIAVCRYCHKREHRRRRHQDRIESWKQDFEALSSGEA